ncbi:hypothetical protein [uncultured Campylobacter sp.]|uniref:hypothetical protein n=1 Tax=uncultured Campylobacter sp. TaxID=218934 RepID=UPI002624BF48|nr:hypothetical protein [uncultured Campylobacter sp.]
MRGNVMKQVWIFLLCLLALCGMENAAAKGDDAPRPEIYHSMKDIYDDLPIAQLPIRYPGEISPLAAIDKNLLDKNELFSFAKESFLIDNLSAYWERIKDIRACRLSKKSAKTILLRLYLGDFQDSKHGHEYIFMCLLNDAFRISDCREIYADYVHCGKSKPPMRAKQEFVIDADLRCTVTTHYYTLDAGKELHRNACVLEIKNGAIVTED